MALVSKRVATTAGFPVAQILAMKSMFEPVCSRRKKMMAFAGRQNVGSMKGLYLDYRNKKST